MLSGVFKVARRRFKVNVDPMDGFERAEVKDSGDLEVYCVEEVWALARHTTSLTDAAIFLLAALCGMRRSEILGLRWRTVLFEQRAILLRRGFTDAGGDRLPKGQRVYLVPMARQVADVLVRLRPDGVDPDARVFPGELGVAMDGSALYRRYKKAQQGRRLRPLRFHDLRHTFGTQAIAGGANVHDLQRWMGHRHLATTMRYVHYRPQTRAPTSSAVASPVLPVTRRAARRPCRSRDRGLAARLTTTSCDGGRRLRLKFRSRAATGSGAATGAEFRCGGR